MSDTIKTEERRIPSSDGVHELYCRVFKPEGEIKGLFHVVHGMKEHVGCYEGLMRALAGQGYLCYGFDNLGHGHTARDKSERGYLGNWKYLTDDVRHVSQLMKAEYGESLPCFVMGHSLGSFIVRCAATPQIWDKMILMGTGSSHPLADTGLALLRMRIKLAGGHALSPTMEKLLFGAYNLRFADENDPIAWLSTLRASRDVHRADKLSHFYFTLNGYETLLTLLLLCNSDTWYRHVSAELPILIISGSDDPVGNYGKGPLEVCRNLRKNGKDVQIKLYQGCRHEILNDLCRVEVTADILRFIN